MSNQLFRRELVEERPVQARPARRRGLKLPSFARSLKRGGIVTVLLIVAVAAAIFFGLKWHDTNNKLAHPDQVTKEQTQTLVDKVGQLTVLPTGEDPTVATVTDISKLKGQAFFANAQNGDKVLIYVKAKQAYLYRPSTNKLINVAPLNINSGTGTTSSTPKKK